MPRITDEEIEYKEKKVKGILDGVTVKLSGSKSGTFTRMANRYKKIDRIIEMLTEQRNKLNEQVKERLGELFNAEDEVLTRVVETVSLTATLSKRTPASTIEVEDFDAQGFIEEIYNTMPELIEQLDEIKKRYTTLNTIEKAEKSPALRVTINEGVEDKLDLVEQYSEKSAEMVLYKLNEYDKKIEHIVNMVG